MASRFFPHAEYAEDQRYGYTILATHVLHRGFQTGAVIGAPGGAIAYALAARRAAGSAAASAPQATSGAPLANASAMPLMNDVKKLGLQERVIRGAGRGALIAVPILAVGLAGRGLFGDMKEEISWQDRSWRLLANEGQVMCDDWSVGGTLAGGLVAAAREQGRSSVGRGLRVVGVLALGNLAGVAGYMFYRYAIRGEKGVMEPSIEGVTK